MSEYLEGASADTPGARLLAAMDGMSEEQMAYVIAHLTDAERAELWRHVDEQQKNPYFRFRHDPLGFVKEGLRETTWSMEDEILEAIGKYRKVVVAASHSVGKSHIASRAAGAVALSWPADMVKVQTTATNYRQVKGILWPYINRMHSKYGMPGEVFTTSWRIGGEEVGEGFSARNTDEAAVSGFHAMGELFLVVDEGGGIHRTLGQAFNNVLTGNGHALVIGNFPTDQDDTWFNDIWGSDEWHRIRISAFHTPNFPRPRGRVLTKLSEVEHWLKVAEEQPDHPDLVGAWEVPGECTVCSATVGPHTIAKHLTDIGWVRSIAAEFGEESGYFQTRVLALPAKNIVAKALPMTWLEEAVEAAKHRSLTVAPIKLGVDPAVDGGDELAIARAIGWRVGIVHHSAGEENQSTLDVAGRVLEQILAAEAYHEEHGIDEPVRVKVDENGVGRGVSDLLKSWGMPGPERKHRSVIIGVNSSRRPHDRKKFRNQRSEMWWTMRGLIQPDPTSEEGGLLELDLSGEGVKLLSQLNAPRWRTDSAGFIVVQPKPEVKKETGRSPDQGDAALLAVYEPPKHAGDLDLTGAVISGRNYWASARA